MDKKNNPKQKEGNRVLNSPRSPLFFISAGDPSGDVHAAHLIEAIVRHIPKARFIGFAGSKTAATSCDVRVDLTKLAVMMLGRAIRNLPTFVGLLKEVDSIFENERPDVVILVDFPGFNWKIAKKAKDLGIPVVYFMPPQIWGWGQWRIKKMRRYVDLILSCFAFEDKWFREQGGHSVLIGHPFFEETRTRSIDNDFIKSLSMEKKRFLTLLPGSRDQEIINNLDDMIVIAEKTRHLVPDIQPVIAAFNEKHLKLAREKMRIHNVDYPIYNGKSFELMSVSTCCLAVSGSVSIELTALCKPTVIVYRVSRLQQFVLRFLKRVKYVTLPNIIAVDRMKNETPFYPSGQIAKEYEHTHQERELMLFPEFVSSKDRTDLASSHLVEWFTDEEKRQKQIKAIENLRSYVDFTEHPTEIATKIIQEMLVTRDMTGRKE